MSPDFLLLAILPDVGGGEMMLILFVVLLLFGGDQMPQMAKKLGKTISQFKRAANEVEREIKRAIDEVPDVPDVRATIEDAMVDKPQSKPSTAPASSTTPASPAPSSTSVASPPQPNPPPVP